VAKKKSAKPVKKKPVKKRSKSGGELSHIADELRPLAMEIGALVLDEHNARKHGDEDLGKLAGVLERYGQVKPIVVNRKTYPHVVIAGNGTLLAAQRLGWKFIAAVKVEADEGTHRGLALADNRVAELSSWDEQELLKQIGELVESGNELGDLLALAELGDSLAGGGKKKGAKKKAAEEQAVTPTLAVQAICRTEAEQEQLFKKLSRQGFECRVLTL
jgi:ParB-like chromosome segregation protein Spo0J